MSALKKQGLGLGVEGFKRGFRVQGLGWPT